MIKDENKTRNLSQDGSLGNVIDPIVYLREDCISKIKEHINSQGTSITPDLKTGFEKLQEKLSETPKTMIFSREASDSLKQLTKKASLIDNQASEGVLLELQQAERLTPPLQDDSPIIDRACNFFGCTIL